jgi:sugar phosphate isomerase/epimerase
MMLKLGYTPFNAQILDLETAFRLAGELELQFVELSWDLCELDPNGYRLARVQELVGHTGIAISLHLPFIECNIASLMPGVTENSLLRIERAFEYGSAAGAMLGVLHTGRIPARHPLVIAGAKARLAASLLQLSPPFPVALENLALDEYDLLRGPGELAAFTPTGFGNTLDLGHALVEGCTTEAQEHLGPGGLAAGHARLASYQAELANIIHLHLQDNHGITDDHLPLGQGSIDWAAQRDFLQSFRGTIDLEVGGGAAGVRESVVFLRQLLAG